MILIGILVTLLGFALSVLSLGMVMVLAGLAISLFGIFGLINRAYLKNAIWRK